MGQALLRIGAGFVFGHVAIGDVLAGHKIVLVLAGHHAGMTARSSGVTSKGKSILCHNLPLHCASFFTSQSSDLNPGSRRWIPVIRIDDFVDIAPGTWWSMFTPPGGTYSVTLARDRISPFGVARRTHSLERSPSAWHARD